MKPAAVRRILGLVTGAALIGIGGLELGIQRSNYESSRVQPFCRLGFCAEQFSPEHVFEIGQKASLGDARGELEDFKRAVRLSPANAYLWANLGEAEYNLHDDAQAEYAFSRALKQGPRSPVILMRAANVEFEIGNSEQVVSHLEAILSDPDLWQYYDTAFLTYSRLGLPIDEILKHGVPQNEAALSRLLMFWTKVGKVDDAVATWNWANQRSMANGEATNDFFAFLIRADQQDLAQQLWQDYARKLEPEYRETNWIYNPSFESAPLSSPFDWKIDEHQDVEATRVQDLAQDGSWSLRLRFNGERNTDYQQTYQYVVLSPGNYKFSVMMKSDQITTDQGVRIHIFEYPTQAHLNVWTDTVLGSRNWTGIEKTFQVPPGIKVIQVQIARQPSMKFDNKIGGTTWIDDFQLTRQ